MTIKELEVIYKRSFAILRRERLMRVAMRDRALGESKVREWEGKIMEIDTVIGDLTKLKDELKKLVCPVEYQQDTLLEISDRKVYL